MGTDFYPRLTAISDDHPRLNATVNEQIEIGVLIALPGLLATLTCGPLLMIVFYSNQFILGAELLPWFVLGVFLRVVSWPLGFAILAKSATRWFFLTQTHFYVVQFALTWLLIRRIGLVGVAIAFFLTLIPAAVLNLAVVYRLTGFTWSIGVIKLLTASTLVVLFAFLSTMVIPVFWNALVGIGLTFGASLYCANGLAARLGRQHKLVLLMLRIPGLRFVLPGSTS